MCVKPMLSNLSNEERQQSVIATTLFLVSQPVVSVLCGVKPEL